VRPRVVGALELTGCAQHEQQARRRTASPTLQLRGGTRTVNLPERAVGASRESAATRRDWLLFGGDEPRQWEFNPRPTLRRWCYKSAVPWPSAPSPSAVSDLATYPASGDAAAPPSIRIYLSCRPPCPPPCQIPTRHAALHVQNIAPAADPEARLVRLVLLVRVGRRQSLSVRQLLHQRRQLLAHPLPAHAQAVLRPGHLLVAPVRPRADTRLTECMRAPGSPRTRLQGAAEQKARPGRGQGVLLPPRMCRCSSALPQTPVSHPFAVLSARTKPAVRSPAGSRPRRSSLPRSSSTFPRNPTNRPSRRPRNRARGPWRLAPSSSFRAWGRPARCRRRYIRQA
jgi:hypothetical protein